MYQTLIMNCSSSFDNVFGPQYCESFDFTLVFEQSFFQIVPCALLLLVIPLRASQLRRQEVKCVRSWAYFCKQAVISFLALGQCSLLIFWALSKNTSPTAGAAEVCPSSLALVCSGSLLWSTRDQRAPAIPLSSSYSSQLFWISHKRVLYGSVIVQTWPSQPLLRLAWPSR
jgi:ATP-binding cassette subfamily C (CFTR/MRP) protein 1